MCNVTFVVFGVEWKQSQWECFSRAAMLSSLFLHFVILSGLGSVVCTSSITCEFCSTFKRIIIHFYSNWFYHFTIVFLKSVLSLFISSSSQYRSFKIQYICASRLNKLSTAWTGHTPPWKYGPLFYKAFTSLSTGPVWQGVSLLSNLSV